MDQHSDYAGKPDERIAVLVDLTQQVYNAVERDRTVVVHAPIGVPEDKLRQLVDSKRQWLFEKLNDAQKYQPLPHAPGMELVNGESALYLGRAYRIARGKRSLRV